MRLPGQLRTALARMLPVLEAREQLAMANAAALGSGQMERRAASRAWRALQRAAHPETARAERAADMEGFIAGLSARGMRVIVRDASGAVVEQHGPFGRPVPDDDIGRGSE